MNLKTIALLGSLLLAAAPALRAQEDMGLEPNQAAIGHTITNQIDFNDAFFGEAGKYTLGARLTAEELQPYETCRIVGVRFAVGQPQSRTRVFINRVDGTNIYDAAAKNVKAVAGWNNVIFPEAITIKEGDSFFYGFDYTETAEMVAAEAGGICGVMSSHTNGAIVMMNRALYPLSGIGDLCVQLIVDITNLTPHNMNFGFFDTGFKYKNISEPFEVFTNISNNGRDPITKFRIGMAFDDFEPEYLDITETVTPGNSYTLNKQIKYPAGCGVGAHNFRVFLESIEDAPVPDDGVKEKSVSFAVFANSESRKKVYVETYAHPETPYSAMLNDVFTAYPDKQKSACFVNVYPAGTELECNISEELHNRYVYTYPCFSTNRAQFPGEPTVAYDFNDYFNLFDSKMFNSIIEQIIENDMYTPSFANLELSGEYNPETRTATINTRITPLADEVPAIFGNLALNLLVVENGVKAPQMIVNRLGSVTESKNYSHPNVLRHACYGVDGIKVESSMEPSTDECVIQFPADWNEKNIRIVALLTPWHEAGEMVDLRDLDIINCNEIRIADLSASIAEIGGQAEGSAEYFTVTGQRTVPSQRGIYLERTANGCRKVLKK